MKIQIKSINILMPYNDLKRLYKLVSMKHEEYKLKLGICRITNGIRFIKLKIHKLMTDHFKFMDGLELNQSEIYSFIECVRSFDENFYKKFGNLEKLFFTRNENGQIKVTFF